MRPTRGCGAGMSKRSTPTRLSAPDGSWVRVSHREGQVTEADRGEAMLDVHVFHKTSRDSLPSIMSDGLRYGEQGRHSQDGRVRATNELLNGVCPSELKGEGVDRMGCIYGYLGVDDKVFDVESGRLVDQERWDVGADNAKLRLLIDPETAFVSDLDAYDALLERLEDRAGEDVLATLAGEYWQRLVRLAEVRDHYRLEDEALVAATAWPSGLPRRLERVEVLITADVATDRIQQL